MGTIIDSKKMAKRVSARKWQGDDQYSWAVFIDGAPYISGLSRREVPFYKQQALNRLMKGA
jgi:hypothetical protein